MVAVPAPDDVRRVLDDSGKPLPGARVPEIADAVLQRAFDTMLLVRRVDARMTQLVRDGRLGFYVNASGEEATHLAAAPLRGSDWVFPSVRDHGAWFWRGYTVEQYVDQLLGNASDPSKGRQLPAHHSARWLNLVSISAPPGTHIPQAVGAAYAAKASGKDDVAMALFGESATSSGEFHVGVNFAGVWKAPCVFVCRNNAKAVHRQTAAKTLAAKAAGYGVAAVRVDGSDALAVWHAASDAIERARAGKGATLIEAMTSRDEDASTAAVRRLRGYLQHRGLWSDAWEAELAQRADQQITDALAAAERKPAPDVATMFEDVYETLPWHLREQRASLKG